MPVDVNEPTGVANFYEPGGTALKNAAACSRQYYRLALDFGLYPEQAGLGMLRATTPVGINGGYENADVCESG